MPPSPVDTAKSVLRDRFGLWPMREAANRMRFALATPRWRRFENAEVARLGDQIGARPSALVACVIPTYQRPTQVVEAVESALAQTVADHVVIVVDDGGGLPLLPSDDRVTAVSLSRNTHIAGLARNVGIRLTRSRYVAFLDDDNTWTADHLAAGVAAIEAGADLIYTAVTRHRADGVVLDVLSQPFDRHQLADAPCYVDTNAVIVRRTEHVLFSRMPRRNSTMPREDWEFVYRLSKDRRVGHIDTRTVHYLVNEASYFTDWHPGA